MSYFSRGITLAALLLTVPALCHAQDKVSLANRATKGQVMRYKENATISVESMGMKLSLEMDETRKVTITDVAANGDITQESQTESLVRKFNGREAPADDDEKNEKTIIVYRPDGSLVSYKKEGGSSDDEDAKENNKLSVRMFPATQMWFPANAVGVGDKWSHEYKANADTGAEAGKADFEILAAEKSGGVDTFKVKMTYKETSAKEPIETKGTLWVEKTSGDSVSSEVEFDGVKILGEDGPGASGKSKSERTEGSPLKGAEQATPVKPGDANAKPGEKKPEEKKPEPKKDKTIDEIVKEYEKVPGLFTLYRKKESGRETLYWEIKEDQLDKYLMLQVTAKTGTSNMNQVVAGDPIKDLLFKFRVIDDKLTMVVPNAKWRGMEGTPFQKAMERSFPEAYLDQFKIEARQPERKSLLINVSDTFRGDIAQLASRFSGGGGLFGGGGGSYSMDREKTFIVGIKNLPENFMVETAYHFQRSGGGGGIMQQILDMSSPLADPRSAPIRVNYNLYFLPTDNGYRPRLADPRIGYFTTDYMSTAKDSDDDRKMRFIQRWQLEKADPKAALSKPKKPIVWWIDNAFPVEYRGAVRDALLMWNKAFEKIGYKDAIEVKQMPDNADWDHADVRYNVVRLVTSEDNGYAVALSRENPLTGQILNASITLDSTLLRVFKLERKHLLEPAAFFTQLDELDKEHEEALKNPELFRQNHVQCRMAKDALREAWFGMMAVKMLAPIGAQISEQEYVKSFIRYVLAHEFGHCLGLRHNFIASTFNSLDDLKNSAHIKQYGTSASVMDYVAFNIEAVKARNVDFFNQTVGLYDDWAIQYGYGDVMAKTSEGELPALRKIAAKSNAPGHAYQSDESADSFDPCIARWDLGKDPLAYWTKNIQMTRHLILTLGQREPKSGRSYWEFTRDLQALTGQYARGAAFISRYIGGMSANRNHKGDPGEKPVSVGIGGKEQGEALSLLNAYIFSENAFSLPKNYFAKLTDDPFESGLNSFPMMDEVSSAQTAALRRVYSPSVLNRIANNEFKAADPTKALTLPTLFRTTGAAVWGELATGKNISALRRNLQRTHVDTLIGMATSGSSAPNDAKMLAWDQLRQLQTKIKAAKHSAKDDYTRIHLDESAMRIARALNAVQTLGGSSAAPRTLSLMDLLGGAKK